jgi:hypothetical protein
MYQDVRHVAGTCRLLAVCGGSRTAAKHPMERLPAGSSLGELGPHLGGVGVLTRHKYRTRWESRVKEYPQHFLESNELGNHYRHRPEPELQLKDNKCIGASRLQRLHTLFGA